MNKEKPHAQFPTGANEVATENAPKNYHIWDEPNTVVRSFVFLFYKFLIYRRVAMSVTAKERMERRRHTHNKHKVWVGVGVWVWVCVGMCVCFKF